MTSKKGGGSAGSFAEAVDTDPRAVYPTLNFVVSD